MSAPQGKPNRREWIALAAITAAALALRLAGIGWGLPNAEHYFSYHPDEVYLLLPAFRFAQGIWNPGFFNYGSLYPYLVGLPAAALGLVPSAPFPHGLTPLYLAGRTVTALLGTATIPLLYVALRRESRLLAWNSALLLAICPLHVINSHYATVDVPATFFLVLAFALALKGAGQPTARNAILAGLFVGLAAATKYNTGLFLLPALLAPLMAKRARAGLAWWLGLPTAAALAFILCNPFIGTPEFRRGFLFEWRHAQAGGTLAFVGTGSGWSYHLLHGLPVALGYPLLAATVAGFVLAFRSRSPAVRASLVWVVLYLFVIGFGRERFIRYLVPLMPFVCVLAASGLATVAAAAKGRSARLVATGISWVVICATGLYAVGQTCPLMWPLDTRDQVWVSSDQGIRDARVGLVQAPWYFHPPVSPFNGGAFSKEMFEEWDAVHQGRVIITGWDVRKLTASRPDVFILSDLESADQLRLRNEQARTFVAALSRVYLESASSMAWQPFSWLAPGRDWAPPDWLYPDPHITMYYRPRPKEP